jgi:methylenetetrahydrofolate reductase (NADPH)
MGKYRDACLSGKFVVSGEIGPPKGTNVEKMLHHIDLLKDKVDGLNVTDNQSAVMRLGSLGVSHEIVSRGGDPIFQMVCRDRNRLGLQSDLLSAHFLGITRVWAITRKPKASSISTRSS